MKKVKKSFLNTSINIKNRTFFLEKHYYIISGGTCFLYKKTIDSCLKIISFFIKRAMNKKKKKFINFIRFNIPYTKKGKKARMGGGKGKVNKAIAKVHMNSIMFIFKNVKRYIMYKVFSYLKLYLPVNIYLKSKDLL